MSGDTPPEAHANREAQNVVQRTYSRLMNSEQPFCDGLLFRARFGLRDFYSFGRYFGRRGVPIDLDHHFPHFLHALERNFNGGSPAQFRRIFKEFAVDIAKVMNPKEHVPHTLARLQKGVETQLQTNARSVVDVVRDAVTDATADRKSRQEDATFVRYLLVLDDTDDDSAVRLLSQCGVVDLATTRVQVLSDFEEDRTERYQTLVVKSIKDAMRKPGTLVLMHASAIHGSLYDLLNQHFTPIKKKDGTTFITNVAIGAYSQPCVVSRPSSLTVVRGWCDPPAAACRWTQISALSFT